MAKAQFDRDEVIEKSINLFWHKGYSASSMQQVVKATGLKPGSIYLAFGNKEGLFREALESYAKKSINHAHKAMKGASSVGEGICRFFEVLIKESLQKNYCSCFLIKTQLELASEKNEIYEFAASKLKEVESVFCSYLEKEFSPEISQQRASSIMLHVFGVRVYGYQQGSADKITSALKEGLHWVPWADMDKQAL